MASATDHQCEKQTCTSAARYSTQSLTRVERSTANPLKTWLSSPDDNVAFEPGRQCGVRAWTTTNEAIRESLTIFHRKLHNATHTRTYRNYLLRIGNILEHLLDERGCRVS